jgi:hypothetical protein
MLALALAAGCAKHPEPLGAPETFHWVAQPITFSPPPARWERQGDNGGGKLGVRFILRGGGGQCISVSAYRLLAERSRRDALERLAANHDSLSYREFLDSLQFARARTDDPISEREAAAAAQVNAALDRAREDYLAGSPGLVANDLETALKAASGYEPTLPEILPIVRLVPERMQAPDRWRLGRAGDTTLAGLPAFASHDTLIAPELPLLYTQVFWVVRGCAFDATFQGTSENLDTFYRLVDSIRFPEAPRAAPR